MCGRTQGKPMPSLFLTAMPLTKTPSLGQWPECLHTSGVALPGPSHMMTPALSNHNTVQSSEGTAGRQLAQVAQHHADGPSPKPQSYHIRTGSAADQPRYGKPPHWKQPGQTHSALQQPRTCHAGKQIRNMTDRGCACQLACHVRLPDDQQIKTNPV
jgi:hypothetical protein